MDDIIIEDIINNRGKSHGELAVRIWMPKKFSKKVEVRGGIRKFKFGAINGEKMEAMPKFSGRDMLVKKVNGEVEKLLKYVRGNKLSGFGKSLLETEGKSS